MAGGAVQPAAATSGDPPPVALGTHRFGHLRPPDSTVAHADAGEVGFEQPPPGADGVAFGPWSFDVAQDGSVWLLDEVDHRLLVWRPGRPDHPARTVRLPLDPLERIADFAVAPDHGVYATHVPPPGPGPKTLRLCRLAPDGKVLWTAPTIVEIFNAPLRIGPDQAVDVHGAKPGHRWTPLTTPAGRPLPVAEQRQRTNPWQALPGGLRLAIAHPSAGERRVTLGNQAGRVLRGWRVTSQDDLGAEVATPALVGGDPVVVVEISKETRAEFLYEYQVLRLARAGGASVRFAIAPDTRAVWGDTPITGVRVGPDGRLYQLRTSHTGGVDIVRYSLTPVQDTRPTTTPAPNPPEPTGPRVDDGGAAAPPVTVPPAQPAAPAATGPGLRPWLPWLAGVTASTLAAVRVEPGGPRRPRRLLGMMVWGAFGVLAV